MQKFLDKKLKKCANNEKFENRRRDVISLNQPRGMSAKITANGIRDVFMNRGCSIP